MLLVTLFLCCAALTSALRHDCPPADSMTCQCKKLPNPTVTCSSFTDEDELKSNLEALKGYKIDKLTIHDVTVPAIVENLYEGLHVEHFVLDKVEVLEKPKVGRKYFAGLEKALTVMQVSESFKKEYPLENLKLDYLTHLEALLMNDNKITEIGNDWFATGPKSLATIALARNGIKRLGDKAFQSLENLQILFLTGNSISTISRSMLPTPATALEKIDLSNNKLTELPVDLFTDMEGLYAVLLHDNQIHTISRETFPPQHLQDFRLYLGGNPLQCDAKLKWLCKGIKVDLHSAECDSPADRKGLPLTAFCDMEKNALKK